MLCYLRILDDTEKIYNKIKKSKTFPIFKKYIISVDILGMNLYLELKEKIVNTRFNLQKIFKIDENYPIVLTFTEHSFDYICSKNYIVKTNIKKIYNDRNIIRQLDIYQKILNYPPYKNNGIKIINTYIKRRGIWITTKFNDAKNYIKKKISSNTFYKKLDNNFDGYNKEDILLIDIKKKCNVKNAAILKKLFTEHIYQISQDNKIIYPIYTKIIIFSKYRFDKYFEGFFDIRYSIQKQINYLLIQEPKNKDDKSEIPRAKIIFISEDVDIKKFLNKIFFLKLRILIYYN